MVAVSLQIEGQSGLTWEHWHTLLALGEECGFDALFRSDHFTRAQPPDYPSLELMVSLAYAAVHTKRIHFGPLVAPFSFRHPTHLARQAAALDDLSGGRMILGVGAGWQEREHHMFGHHLGPTVERILRLEEGLEVIIRLLRSDQPVSFEGRFFQLHDAILLPRPRHPGSPAILVGGTGQKRTLPLVARFADMWNAANVTPETFAEYSKVLDALLDAQGRSRSAVKRTVMTRLYFAHDIGEMQALPWGHQVESLRSSGRGIAGTADMIIQQIDAYAAAGVDELMLQWFDLDDSTRLRAFATSVLPVVRLQSAAVV